jgi:hypothetical protein
MPFARYDSPELGRGQMLLARRLVILISGLGISSLMVRLLEQSDSPVSLQKGTLIALRYPLDGSNVSPRSEAVRVLRGPP